MPKREIYTYKIVVDASEETTEELVKPEGGTYMIVKRIFVVGTNTIYKMQMKFLVNDIIKIPSNSNNYLVLHFHGIELYPELRLNPNDTLKLYGKNEGTSVANIFVLVEVDVYYSSEEK